MKRANVWYFTYIALVLLGLMALLLAAAQAGG